MNIRELASSSLKTIAIIVIVLAPSSLFLPIMYFSSNFLITVISTILIFSILSLIFITPLGIHSNIYKTKLKDRDVDIFWKEMIFYLSLISFSQLALLYTNDVFNITHTIIAWILHILLVTLLVYLRAGYIEIKDSTILVENRMSLNKEIEYSNIKSIDIKENKIAIEYERDNSTGTVIFHGSVNLEEFKKDLQPKLISSRLIE